MQPLSHSIVTPKHSTPKIDKSKGDVEFVRQVWVELQEWDEHQAKTQEPLS